MRRFNALILASSLLGLGAFAAAADQPQPAEVAADQQPGASSIYGPILSQDPATRVEIKQLYRELAAATEASMDEIAVLQEEIADVRDMEIRIPVIREIGDIKAQIERTNMELGLQIAQLNEDLVRVTEYELALDHLNNPEKYAAPREIPVREVPSN